MLAVLVSLTRLLTAESAGKACRLVAVLAVLLLWCAPAIIASQALVSLPEWLRAELLIAPRLPLGSAAALEQVILMGVAPATLALIFLGKGGARGKLAELLLGAFAFLALLVTINPFLDYGQPMGIAWRLSILAYVEIAVLVPGLIWLAGRNRKAALLVAAFVTPLMIVSGSYSRPFSLRHEYMAARAAHLQRLPLYRGRLAPDALVISPHGEQFTVTYALGIPAQQKWPAGGKPKTIYWLLHSVPSKFLLPSMPVVMRDGTVTQTILALDADVRQQLGRLSNEERQWLLSVNPQLKELPAQHHGSALSPDGRILRSRHFSIPPVI